jgi:hypothetical protein
MDLSEPTSDLEVVLDSVHDEPVLQTTADGGAPQLEHTPLTIRSIE